MSAADRGRGSSGLVVLAACALALTFAAAIGDESFVDPDVYHLMALAREVIDLGHMPLEDRFAYTPTVVPCVHHEWGSGMVLYLLVRGLGAAGLLVLKLALAAGIAVLCTLGARRRGAAWSAWAFLAPVGVLLLAGGFSTVRAQLFTLLFTAALLAGLEADRRGERAWLFAWLLAFSAWVNLHAGFVVGGLLFSLHAVESRLRGRPVRHLVLALAAMGALVLLNPYGWRLVPAVWHGLRLDRSLVTEWDPIWREAPAIVAAFVFSIGVVAYALSRRGWRSLEGLPLLVAAGLAACLHQRHLSIYGVIWASLVPAWSTGTPLGLALQGVWTKGRRPLVLAWIALGLVCGIAIANAQPWRLRVPANPGDHGVLAYPAGAVDYLRDLRFEGNVMTPFTAGAYVSWHLHPRVKVSFDGRYEAAYPPGAALENRDFYTARDGWRRTLDAHPTDIVLAPARAPISDVLPSTGWAVCYRDDAFALWTRPALVLPSVDRRGSRVEARFP